MRRRLTGRAARVATCTRAAAAAVLVSVAFGASACARVGTGTTGAPSAEELRAELDACREQHRIDASADEVLALREELRAVVASVESGERRRTAMRKAMDEYARGVCLVHGVFTFFEATDGGDVRVSGPDGRPLTLEYLGSGFLASDRGHVATNRHVAEPWWNNESVLPLLRRGLRPGFVSLSVTFPGRAPVPVERDTIRVSDQDVDLAVFRVDIDDLPVLPLSVRDPGELRGDGLMLLGYPTGLAALMARAEPEVASAAMSEASDTDSLIRSLSARGGLLPVSTHGTLNHVTPHKLIYDAVTTSGGSGGPVFGPNGEVIGVNFAVLRGFQGSNFGVPIRFLTALMK